MIFADLAPDMQGRVIAKAWQAIRLDVTKMDDRAVDDLMAEWIDGLQRLSVEEIALGVKACQRTKRTAPIEDFVALCREKPERPAKQPAVKRPGAAAQGFDESKRESYVNLGLQNRWGPPPKYWE